MQEDEQYPFEPFPLQAAKVSCCAAYSDYLLRLPSGSISRGRGSTKASLLVDV